jgi:hypothetical protein
MHSFPQHLRASSSQTLSHLGSLTTGINMQASTDPLLLESICKPPRIPYYWNQYASLHGYLTTGINMHASTDPLPLESICKPLLLRQWHFSCTSIFILSDRYPFNLTNPKHLSLYKTLREPFTAREEIKLDVCSITLDVCSWNWPHRRQHR